MVLQTYSAGCSFTPPMVEHRGFEPLTPTLPVLCAPNCANAPLQPYISYHIPADLSSTLPQFFCFPRNFFEISREKTLDGPAC